MKRRHFIKHAGIGSLATAAAVSSKPAQAKAEFRWKMVTAWPKNFPVLGTNAILLAKTINTMSGGRINIKVYGANEMVPAFEVFDAVSKGTADMGHAGAFYWKGKTEAAQFFSSVPFGLTAQEMNAWLYYGGGMELWRELYAPFGLIPTATGNSGVQMAGWFNKQINTVDDLKGLKMRIPGLGGEVLKRAGGTPVTLPGNELFTALQSGTIDASEWVGPYNDLAFGFYKVAKYYYYPGWHEPGSTMECIINQNSFKLLPDDLKSIVMNACKAANIDMLAEFTARNNQALNTLVNKHQVKVLPLPDQVLKILKKISDEVIKEMAQKDPMSAKIYDSFNNFRIQVEQWGKISEQAYLHAREL